MTQNLKTVEIIVNTQYNDSMSNPKLREYFFNYHITIINHSSQIIQLISRKWWIMDDYSSHKFVEGPGVVGKQPTLMPGDSFNYTSGCLIFNEIGKMYGEYTFLNYNSNQNFDVAIEEFNLITPWLKN